MWGRKVVISFGVVFSVLWVIREMLFFWRCVLIRQAVG